MERLRILCLHGYHGNAKVLRAQTSAFASGLDDLADLVYVDAPSLAERDFGWWHAIRDESSLVKGDRGVGTEVARYEGWARTRDWILSPVQDRRTI